MVDDHLRSLVQRHRRLVHGPVHFVHLVVPLLLVPIAVVPRRARHGGEDLGHDARCGAVVGPDAALHETSRDREVLGAREDFAAQRDHAADEAGEMLRFRLQIEFLVGFALDCARKKDVVVSGCVGPEEEMFLCGFDDSFVHVLVLRDEAAEHEVLFW